MNVRSATATILIGILITSHSMAGKPPPPPPPPPPTQTCPVETGIAFPALVYSKAKYKILKKFGGSQLYDGSDLYIANSTGTCSILIYPGTRDSSALSVSYRQIMENGSSVGHVAYVDGDGQQIKLLKFTVLKDANNTKYSVQGLPLSSSVVFAYNAPSSGINDVALSADGQTIYFSDEQLTSDGRWIDTVNSLDVSTNCSPVCPKTVIFDEFPDDSGVAGLSINDDEDRLYMAIHFRVPDIRTISRLEKQTDGAWAFRNVVSDQDPGYPAVDGFASTALGIWNSRDVVAYVVERYSTGNTTDIIDVSSCDDAPVGDLSCLASGYGSVVRGGIAGSGTSFTSTPSSPTDDDGPNLLVSGGGQIGDLDLGDPNAAPVQFLAGCPSLPASCGSADSAD